MEGLTRNIKQQQIQSEEQKTILCTLAESVSRPGCHFLEVGSWCGDSTVLIGRIAKNDNGKLFCVDWWKGNPGTDLFGIAAKEDIFSFFWDRICREGLDEVVVPIRTRSDVAAQILKNDLFDLIFLDGDHGYDGALTDIRNYAPLVRRGGILCGHDCEGRISDYEKGFLETGKNMDYYETVHCGVVLAVGTIFNDSSINHNIWSVRACVQGNDWEPTNLVFPGIEDRRQGPPPPPIGFTKNYELLRYGRLVYAFPRSLGHFDITNEENRKHPEIIVSETMPGIEKLIGEKVFSAPVLLESYKRYNLVQHDNLIYALSQDLGQMDLIRIDECELSEYRQSGKCAIGGSLDEAKDLVDQLVSEDLIELVEEGHKGFNIVLYRGKYYAISQSLGPVDFTRLEEQKLREYQENGKCFIGNSLYEAKHLVDQMLSLHEDISDRLESTGIKSMRRVRAISCIKRWLG